MSGAALNPRPPAPPPTRTPPARSDSPARQPHPDTEQRDGALRVGIETAVDEFGRLALGLAVLLTEPNDDGSPVSVGQFRVRDVLVARQDKRGAAFEIVRDGPEAQRILRQDYAGLLLAMSTVVTVCSSMPVITYTS